MRFLYITDLHGDKNKYEKILAIALENDIKLIVDGGDMLPKHCKRMEEQPRFVKEYLKDYFDKLKENNITYIGMLGNDDILPIDKDFNELCNLYNNVNNIASSKINVEGYDFIGMNYILDHPFGCKDRVVMEDNYVFQRQLSSAFLSSEKGHIEIPNWFEYATSQLPKMENKLNDLPISSNYEKTIFIIHMPPANLKLGQLLYQDLDIGSVDIYNFIQEKQPLLTLHGHIHESPDTETGKWINSINNTTCIQPGQSEVNNDILIYVDIDLENKKYTREVISINC